MLVCYRSVPTLLLLSMPSMVKIPVDEEITGLRNSGQGERKREREGGEIGRFEIVTHGLSGMSL